MADTPKSGPKHAPKSGPKSGAACGRRAAAPASPRRSFAIWSKAFLAELASTSNVAASARKAGIDTSTAYEARRTRPDFNRQWHRALCEGYDHLEMELLHRLRMGELKPATGARRAARQFDNGTAFRLLAVHREAVAQERAMQENEDADAILASIDAKLDRMRERALQAAAHPEREPDAKDTDDEK